MAGTAGTPVAPEGQGVPMNVPPQAPQAPVPAADGTIYDAPMHVPAAGPSAPSEAGSARPRKLSSHSLARPTASSEGRTRTRAPQVGVVKRVGVNADMNKQGDGGDGAKPGIPTKREPGGARAVVPPAAPR